MIDYVQRALDMDLNIPVTVTDVVECQGSLGTYSISIKEPDADTKHSCGADNRKDHE